MAINNISFEILERLLRKSSISTNDRCQIDSFVYASLADFCNDIKPNEIEKVHILEERNLYRYMNAACTVLGYMVKMPLISYLRLLHLIECILNLHWNTEVKNFKKTLSSL